MEGRIDSSNAAEAEQNIIEECGKYPAETVIADAEKLEYISSAGLRVLLKLKKEKKDVQIIPVSNDVYEIFEMTGFVDIMDIKKRLRKFSVEGCKLIGQGGFGKVYRYDPETIIKVYRLEVEIDYIKRERQCSKVAFTSGLPTATAFDMARVGDAYGVMYELMDYELSNVYYEKKVKALEKLAVEKGCDKKSIENVRTMIGVSRELLEDILKFIDIQGSWILSIPVIRMKYPFMEKIRQKRNVWKWKRLSKRYRK